MGNEMFIKKAYKFSNGQYLTIIEVHEEENEGLDYSLYDENFNEIETGFYDVYNAQKHFDEVLSIILLELNLANYERIPVQYYNFVDGVDKIMELRRNENAFNDMCKSK